MPEFRVALGARWRYLVDATMSAAQASARAARWRANAQAWRGTRRRGGMSREGEMMLAHVPDEITREYVVDFLRRWREVLPLSGKDPRVKQVKREAYIIEADLHVCFNAEEAGYGDPGYISNLPWAQHLARMFEIPLSNNNRGYPMV